MPKLNQRFKSNNKREHFIKMQIQHAWRGRTSVQCYIQSTTSKDFCEIKAHCKQLIKISKFTKNQHSSLCNWLQSKLTSTNRNLTNILLHQKIQQQNKKKLQFKFNQQIRNNKKRKKQSRYKYIH